MTEPRVTPHALTRNLAEYYHWEETDRGIRIYIHSGMVDRLQAEVLGGAASGPDGGTEVGGILLGRVEEDRGKAITVIDDFVPVPCSYRGEPLYTLSDEDTVNLEAALLRAALAQCESPDAPSILGYYRSHIRDGLSLSPADLLVIDSYFQAPASVFLIVKPLAGTKACTAGFFFWEDGRIQSEFSSLEVALGRTPSLPLAAGDVPDLPDTLGDDVPAGLSDDLTDDLPDDLADLFRKAALPERSTASPPERATPPNARGGGRPARATRQDSARLAGLLAQSRHYLDSHRGAGHIGGDLLWRAVAARRGGRLHARCFDAGVAGGAESSGPAGDLEPVCARDRRRAARHLNHPRRKRRKKRGSGQGPTRSR